MSGQPRASMVIFLTLIFLSSLASATVLDEGRIAGNVPSNEGTLGDSIFTES